MEGREKATPAKGWMRQGDVRGMQWLQSLREAGVQTLYFLSLAKNKFMYLSAWTTSGGACYFKKHAYDWTLFFKNSF